MGPYKKNITSEDLTRLYLISKILKLQNPQPFNNCHEDLMISGYLPDIDAEEESLSEGGYLLSEDSIDYYQEFFIRGSVSLPQPLELLVNTVSNLFSPNVKVKTCSGRASTSAGKNVNTNSGKTPSMGAASIRTKLPAPGSIACRTSLSTEEKQVKKSGVGFFHRTNDRFYTRNGGFDSSSGSDDTSSSTAGDETDDEIHQQGNRQNRSQITKKMQPITYLSRVPQGRRNTVRNGSLPNRPIQKDTTSRPSINSINKAPGKSSTSVNQTITATAKSRSTSTTNTLRKSTPIFNAVQSTATSAIRSSSANPGASKTSGKKSTQKASLAEKGTQKEKPFSNNELQNVQQAKEKEILATTLDQVTTITPYVCEPSNYTTVERTNECQEVLTLAKKAEKGKTQPCSGTNKEKHSQKNQNEEMCSSSGQINKHFSNGMPVTTTTYQNMNNFVNEPFNISFLNQDVVSSTLSLLPHPISAEEEREIIFEDAAEILQQHAFPEGKPDSSQQSTINPKQHQVIRNPSSNFHSTEVHHREEQLSNVPSFHSSNIQLHSHLPPQSQQIFQQQQQQNPDLYIHQPKVNEFQQQLYESPPQNLSQPTSHDDNRVYPPQLHQPLIIRTPPNFQQQISPPQQRFQSPQMYPTPSYVNALTPSNALPSSYTINQFHSHHQTSNVPTRPQHPVNWATNSSPEFYASPLPVVPDFSQSSSPNVAISSVTLSHRSPQVFDGTSPQMIQQRPAHHHTTTSISAQYHHQQTPCPQYSSPPETQHYINSPATPMSNPHQSPLPPPPPYPINNGLANFSNGNLSSASIANANSFQEPQQRRWEQQQYMVQQNSWHQFNSPQHPQVEPLQHGPGMYSVPPNCYGYPAPTGTRTISETPSKATKTPKKKQTPPTTESALNRLLSAPSRMSLSQSQFQSNMYIHHRHQNPQQIYPQPVMVPLQRQRYPMVNPQVLQQQSQSGNMQQQYYMVPVNLPSNMQISSHHQQPIGPSQFISTSLPSQHHQFIHPTSIPQHVSFQQLSLSSPRQPQQPLSQSEQTETFITSPQNLNLQQTSFQHNQQHAPAILQHHLQQTVNVQSPSSQVQQHVQQKYSGSEPFANNPVISQNNSPFSNRSIPNSSTPNFQNSTSFYPSNNMSANRSPGNLEFSPTNPQLTDRLTNFNSALLSNPVSAISPFASPNNIATVTPSPPKTPNGKRFHSLSNSDDNEDISNKKKQCSPPTISSVEKIMPTSRPPSYNFHAHSHSSTTSFSSTMNKPTQNGSYTSSFNQHSNPQLKAVFGLQEHSSPFAEANNFYNCPTFDISRSKEPGIGEAMKNNTSGIAQNSELHSSNVADQSNCQSSNASKVQVNSEQMIATNTVQLITSAHNGEVDEIDPCEEFLDPEVINGTKHSDPVLNTSVTPEADETVESVVENSGDDGEKQNVQIIIGLEDSSSLINENSTLIEVPGGETENEENNLQARQAPEPNFNAECKDLIPRGELEIEKETAAPSHSSTLLSHENLEIGETIAKSVVDNDGKECSLQRKEILEQSPISNAEQKDSTPTEESEGASETALILINEELEEGEIAESPESIEQEVACEGYKKNDIIRKRLREFDDDDTPVVEEKRQKIATESNSIISHEIGHVEEISEELQHNHLASDSNINDAPCIIEAFEQASEDIQNISDEALLSDSPMEDDSVIHSNNNSGELDNAGPHSNATVTNVSNERHISTNTKDVNEELLLADSPEFNKCLKPVTVEKDFIQSNTVNIENSMDSNIENNKLIDEESLLADSLLEEPLEERAKLDRVETVDENQHDEIMDENVLDESVDESNECGMADSTGGEHIPPSYEELLQSLNDSGIENDEMLAKVGASAAMDATTTICTLNVIRNEVHQAITDLSATTSIEQSIMVNLVNETVDSQFAEMKEKYLTILNVIDTNLQNFIKSNSSKSGKQIEEALLEAIIPLYTAALEWEKLESKVPQYYINITYVKKLLLTMIANFGLNKSRNIWNEFFTLQMFSTSERLNIFYQLLTKSINVCTFLDEYFSLVNDLFGITQFAAALFIKDYNEFKESDPDLVNVITGATKRIRELTPELRSRIVFKFQLRIHQFLHKFENSNISPEAYSFISTLSWDMNTLGDSRDLPNGGYLSLSQKINPTVDKIFKETLEQFQKHNMFEIKGWSFNFTQSILQSNFMSRIIRNSNNMDKKFQEALFSEIIPTLLKLALSLPHLFLAADPYHSLELIPSVFEDALPILKKAVEDNHEQTVVPFMPFATIMGALKNYAPQNIDFLLKSCLLLYCALKNAPNNIPKAIEAERRRCSFEILYQKIHREFVRRQMGKCNIRKFSRDYLDLNQLHSIISKLFTSKALEYPPRIIVAIKDGDQEAVSTEKIFRAEMISKCCKILGDVLNDVTTEQKLAFIIDHPLLNESLNVTDILNIHQHGKDRLGCFTSFLGLLSLPNDKILVDTKSSEFFKSIKQRRNAIYYYAIKNSALIKNNKPQIPIQILEKDGPVYDILVKTFVNAEMKRNLCCPDNVSAYLYLILIIQDIPGININVVSEHLLESSGITEKKVEFFATCNFAKDLEVEIEKIMRTELESMIKNISSRVNAPGIPRIVHHELSNRQTKILQLKCLIIEIYATFWNPNKLLSTVGRTLDCRKKVEYGIRKLGKLLITGFFHMGKNTITVEQLESMILEEMSLIQGNGFSPYENSSVYGLILYIQELFCIQSIISAALILLYVFTITNDNQLYAHRITLAQQISREPKLLKIFGLKNSELFPIGVVKTVNALSELEKLFEQDYILHASESDPEIFCMFLDQPFNVQYRELVIALESDCRKIKNRFRFHVNNQRNRYHPNGELQQILTQDYPLTDQIPNNMLKKKCKEVPENYLYFPR